MNVEAEIKPPIIVVCDTAYVFDTLTEAEDYIEPWDADDCAAFDSEGRLLRMIGYKDWRPSKAQSRSKSFKERLAHLLSGHPESPAEGPSWTKIIPDEAEPTHAREAADAIRNRLIGLNEPWGKKWPGLGLSPEWLISASLYDLIEYVRSRGGDI
jgi:hypothetical protein